jgi:hypothetical protein
MQRENWEAPMTMEVPDWPFEDDLCCCEICGDEVEPDTDICDDCVHMKFKEEHSRQQPPLPEPKTTSWNGDDMVFLWEIGAIDFGLYAGSMRFQNLIHERGTKEEQDRLRAMGLGYPW